MRVATGMFESVNKLFKLYLLSTLLDDVVWMMRGCVDLRQCVISQFMFSLRPIISLDFPTHRDNFFFLLIFNFNQNYNTLLNFTLNLFVRVFALFAVYLALSVVLFWFYWNVPNDFYNRRSNTRKQWCKRCIWRP